MIADMVLGVAGVLLVGLGVHLFGPGWQRFQAERAGRPVRRSALDDAE